VCKGLGRLRSGLRERGFIQLMGRKWVTPEIGQATLALIAAIKLPKGA